MTRRLAFHFIRQGIGTHPVERPNFETIADPRHWRCREVANQLLRGVIRNASGTRHTITAEVAFPCNPTDISRMRPSSDGCKRRRATEIRNLAEEVRECPNGAPSLKTASASVEDATPGLGANQTSQSTVPKKPAPQHSTLAPTIRLSGRGRSPALLHPHVVLLVLRIEVVAAESVGRLDLAVGVVLDQRVIVG
jgi:hypothetical protein